MDGDAEEEGAAVAAAGLGVALRKPFFMARDGPNTLHRQLLPGNERVAGDGKEL